MNVRDTGVTVRRAKRITAEAGIYGVLILVGARFGTQLWWAYRVRKFVHDIERDRRSAAA